MRRQYFNSKIGRLFKEKRPELVLHECHALLREIRGVRKTSHPEELLLLDHIAQAYFEMGDNARAILATKDVLGYELDGTGGCTADYARNLSNLGLLYRRAGRLDDARQILSHALQLIDKLPTSEQWERPIVMMNLARVYADQKDFGCAEQLLLEAVKQRLADCGSGHVKYGELFAHLSGLYWKMGRFGAAERAIKKAIRIYREHSLSDSVELARMLRFYGDLLAGRGKIEDANIHYLDALELARRCCTSKQDEVDEIERRLTAIKDIAAGQSGRTKGQDKGDRQSGK